MADPFSVFIVLGHKNCLYAIEKHAVMRFGVENLSLRAPEGPEVLSLSSLSTKT